MSRTDGTQPANYAKGVTYRTEGEFLIITVLFKTKSLHDTKPNINPKTNPNSNTNPIQLFYATQVGSTLSSPPLSLSITPSLFHYRLKTHLFLKSFPP